MKYFIGPMSKNTTDVIIDYTKEYNTEIVLIPSRRQIESTGGYVNNWTTEEFCKYVKKNSSGTVKIERDHGGPGQGYKDDDGFESLDVDCKYLDLIHIDPWKKYPAYNDGLEWTIKLLEYSYTKNNNLQFEIATEESIRPFSEEELEQLLKDIIEKVNPLIVKQIQYVVIQCGTALNEKKNIGTFDGGKLSRMLEIVHRYGFEAKEHNGDWVDIDVIRQKESLGLRNINIAPEFGEIETTVLLEEIEKNEADYEEMYRICYNSDRWRKWVKKDFIPDENKRLLILICGHYIFSYPEFLKIKEKYLGIDAKIKTALKNKLNFLNGIYTERKECIMCKKNDFNTLLSKDTHAPLSFRLYDTIEENYFMPYNVISCKGCATVQTKYLGNLQYIYGKNHVDSCGCTKGNMHSLFSDFVTENKNIDGIIEVGASTDALARSILTTLKTPYSIIEPDFKEKNDTVSIISNFIEEVDLNTINGNTMIMSQVFEHFYNPVNVLKQIQQSSLKYLILNHPNLEYFCKNNVHNILNTEHIFYIENDYLINLISQYGFEVKRKVHFKNHCIFIEFERTDSSIQNNIVNTTAYEDVTMYFTRLRNNIEKFNLYVKEHPTENIYLWPSCMYNIMLFMNGLDISSVKGVLDNSPNKIGKKMYGYNLKCYNFYEILNSHDSTITIFLNGSSEYKNELNLDYAKVKVIDFKTL